MPDVRNIEWHFSGGERGYPAGSFYSHAIEVVLEGQASSLEHRLSHLLSMLAGADLWNADLLRAVLPAHVWTLIQKRWDDTADNSTLLYRLRPTLQVLPALLVAALPQLRDCLIQYGRQAGGGVAGAILHEEESGT